MKISVTILTKNSAAQLKATLSSLQNFPEVIVLDTGSTDETLTLARQFSNVKIHQAEFKGFGPSHNEASQLASHDWILSIDSDEIVTPELEKELEHLELDPANVYTIERQNYFNGKLIRSCSGWYPDFVIRLYHRRKTRFSEDAVHERILTRGLHEIRLKAPLKHTPYRTFCDFIEKMQNYSTLFAKQRQGRETSSLGKAVIRGIAAFLKSYFLKWGFMGGKEGLIISLYNSQTTYYKYLKLAELNKNL